MTPNTNPVPTSDPSPFPSPASLTATAQLFVSMGFPVLDVSYTWNHTVWDLLSLASFPARKVSKLLQAVACWGIPSHG